MVGYCWFGVYGVGLQGVFGCFLVKGCGVFGCDLLVDGEVICYVDFLKLKEQLDYWCMLFCNCNCY